LRLIFLQVWSGSRLAGMPLLVNMEIWKSQVL
jgi:hypothetical protein